MKEKKNPRKENHAKPAAPKGATRGAIDPQVWQSLRELEAASSPGLMESLITLFLQQADEKLAVMRTAFSKGDRETARATAHTLKSAAGNLGAMRFSSLCQEIETGAREKSELDRKSLEALNAEYIRVRQALEAELTALSSAA